jgi:hypothetical protein
MDPWEGMGCGDSGAEAEPRTEDYWCDLIVGVFSRYNEGGNHMSVN